MAKQELIEVGYYLGKTPGRGLIILLITIREWKR